MSDEPSLLITLGYKISAEASSLPLDPIAKVGNLNLSRLRRWALQEGCQWVNEALETISCNKTFCDLLEPRGSSRQVDTRNNLSQEDLNTLKATRLIRKAASKDVISWAKIFKIPKTNLNSRLIINAIDANAQANPPPDLILPRLKEIIRELQELGPAHYITADLRHWFFQIPICDNFSRTMGLRVQGSTWIPCVLPMGHSWSASLAHRLCWAIILYRQERVISMLEIERTDLEHTPKILFLKNHHKNVVGLIMVYYDNVVIATKDLGLAKRWEARLIKNARALGAIWKDPQPRISSGRVTYLGVEYEWDCNFLRSRISEEKFSKWHSRISLWKLAHEDKINITAREGAQWISRLVWATRVANLPLHEADYALRLLAEWAPETELRGWERTLSTEETIVWGGLTIVFSVHWVPGSGTTPRS